MYLILPETENRTLEDIELHFSDNKRKLTDRKIAKSSDKSKNVEMEATSSISPVDTFKSKLDSIGPVTYVNEVYKPVNSVNGHCNHSYLDEK